MTHQLSVNQSDTGRGKKSHGQAMHPGGMAKEVWDYQYRPAYAMGFGQHWCNHEDLREPEGARGCQASYLSLVDASVVPCFRAAGHPGDHIGWSSNNVPHLPESGNYVVFRAIQAKESGRPEWADASKEPEMYDDEKLEVQDAGRFFAVGSIDYTCTYKAECDVCSEEKEFDVEGVDETNEKLASESLFKAGWRLVHWPGHEGIACPECVKRGTIEY